MPVKTQDMKGTRVVMSAEQRRGATLRGLGEALASKATLEPVEKPATQTTQRVEHAPPAQREQLDQAERAERVAQQEREQLDQAERAERVAQQEREKQARANLRGWAHYSAAERVCIGALMLILGVPLWWVGGSALLDGAVIGINLALSASNMGLELAPITGDARLIALPILALLFSVVEIRTRPRRPYFSRHTFAVIVLILAAHAINLGATYLAVASVAPGAWELQVWASEQVWPAALWAFVLTYVPEVLIVQALAALGVTALLQSIWRRFTR